MSFNEWMVKQIVMHPYHGIQLSNKKEQIINIYNKVKKYPKT